MNDLDYGPVFVFRGQHKGRILYYDDNEMPKTAICYVGHPLDFVGTYNIPTRFLREPTIDELLKRRQEIGNELTNYAIDKDWDVRAGPACLNKISASISGASAGFRLPSGVAAS